MTTDIQVPRIRSEETPREIIVAFYVSNSGELPINGGWGYTKEDAVVIDKEDPVVLKGILFDGVGIEYIFVEERIDEELIRYESEDGKYSVIRWNLLEQRLIFDDDRKYDVLSYEVTAVLESDWDTLKTEWESNTELQGSESEAEIWAHIEKRNIKMITYSTECWFDITSFYGAD
jgi:hypothetical protein